ncbi:hypothetical protein [Streptomyces sp. MBT65]|nr:hypothetical protein [Streptomyces sp. MBT65]
MSGTSFGGYYQPPVTTKWSSVAKAWPRELGRTGEGRPVGPSL